MARRALALAACLVGGLVSACAAPWVPPGHLVRVDTDGGPPDATTSTVLDGLRAHLAAGGRPEVVFFFHDSMETPGDGLSRAARCTPVILGPQTPGAPGGPYPVFVDWPSSLTSSYAESLFLVRGGQRAFESRNTWLDDAVDGVGVLLFPIKLAADLARAVVRVPLVFVQGVRETLEWAGVLHSPQRRAAEVVQARLETGAEGFPIEDGTDRPGTDSNLFATGAGVVWSVVTLPVRLVTTLGLDTTGHESWEVLQRRAELIFQTEADFDGTSSRREAEGLMRFMGRVAAFQSGSEDGCTRAPHAHCDHSVRVMLVAHGTGALLLNRLLAQEALAPELPLPEFSSLVYLGAAGSIREYEHAAFPYLQQHPQAEVFHVVLNPRSELGQRNVLDLAPQGSELTWIDGFMSDSLTPQDRTAGRWVNLLPALHDTPSELRSRVHVRLLGPSEPGMPRIHADFGRLQRRFRFWDPSSWMTPGR